MTEEFEVNVQDVNMQETESRRYMAEGLRRLLLAGIGAVALSRDETDDFVNKLVARGELAQKDAEKMLHEVQNRLRDRRPVVEQQAERVGARVEQGVEDFLTRLNIPSKRDIDELSAKISQLAARVEELRRQP